MHTKQLTIIGGGGHSKVVIDALELCEGNNIISLCDDNPQVVGKIVGGHVVATTPPLSQISANVHVAIGNNQVREKIYRSLSKNAALFTIIHPSAVISKTAEIAGGSFIAANAILAPDSNIGEGCIINHGAIVDHDVNIGPYSHIAPNSTLGGNVSIGVGVLIGSGAVVLPGIMIGNGATVGAGAVVTRNVPENSVVKGVPAG
ncbi:acetyltransferase [Legionella cardiaca]|uniref:Acetyltransferase n=1 Tax=Legionella cardiaca TaxID=1071983 RepID=A0ABY8AQ55_9GAMM|nr:acetyltransferase [Legionella cardiaca]WED41919.1 acetyltransferase [Legionella cardiaca]